MSRLFVIALVLITSIITHTVHAKAYKGAELYSNQSYTYGRYEMRMRMAKGSGILSTFFLYKNGSEIGNTFWEEIDIEVFGKNNAQQLQSNIILGTSRPTVNTEQVYTANSSLADAYHTYVLEWTPDYVAWYLDGQEVRRINGTSTVTSLVNPESIRFNIWSSEATGWVGSFDDSVLPQYQFIKYLDYKAYNATTKTFEGGWRDEFDTIDSSRWGKGTWTFDGNRVDFDPANAVAKDGVLILALTKENATGFSGSVPADDDSGASASSSSNSLSSSSSSSSISSMSSSSSSSAVSSAAPSTKKSSGGGNSSWLILFSLVIAAYIRRAH